jgi:hypothetical protein
MNGVWQIGMMFTVGLSLKYLIELRWWKVLIILGLILIGWPLILGMIASELLDDHDANKKEETQR